MLLHEIVDDIRAIVRDECRLRTLLKRMKCQRVKSNCEDCVKNFYSMLPVTNMWHGKCGVAVIRISGSNASNAIWKMTESCQLPTPRLAVLKNVYDPSTMEKLDRGIVLWFPGPKSFTGEDCCEFQVHGGPAVVSSVLSALSQLENFRPAEPGEFTKRAFYNGKLDLTEIEGLGDLIHAETEMQRKQALLQMDGVLSKLYKKWRATLLQNVAHVEAFIDFSEDENIGDTVLEEARKQLLDVKSEIEKHLNDGRKGEKLRQGVKATIVGKPNAGKSSLFNALCNRPAAIVTPIPGTTRDLIETCINVSGYPLILTDTAGLRNDASDLIEIEGISRAYSTMKESDLFIIVIDSTNLKTCMKNLKDLQLSLIQHVFLLNINGYLDLEPECMTNPNEWKEISNDLFSSKKVLFVLNKIDLLNEKIRLNLMKMTQSQNIICTSCASNEGISSFTEALTSQLKYLCGCPSKENPVLTKARHRYHLGQCCYYLDQYLTLTDMENLPVAAYQIRKSLAQIGKITGEVDSEEILDVIFQDFCIGK